MEKRWRITKNEGGEIVELPQFIGTEDAAQDHIKLVFKEQFGDEHVNEREYTVANEDGSKFIKKFNLSAFESKPEYMHSRIK